MTHKMLPSLAGDPLGKLSHVAVNGTAGGALWPILEDSSQDDPQAHFWEWSRDATAARAETEGWSHDDNVAAFIQCSFLSSASNPLNADRLEPSDCPASPADFVHNAPWNDWTPPSKSRQRFEKAQANKQPELVEKRVRVHICASPDAAGQRNRVIAFASVEMIAGKKCLQFRRGSAILAAMAVSSLQVTCIGDRMMVLAPRPHSKLATSPVVFLSFEDQARASKFSNLFV
jgi:hypothetical protein